MKNSEINLITEILVEVRHNRPHQFYNVVSTLAERYNVTPDIIRVIHNNSLETCYVCTRDGNFSNILNTEDGICTDCESDR